MPLAQEVTLSSGDTSWLLVSSALVLLMTPGLAFFYGGLNRSKSVLNMMMMSFASIGLVSVLWLFYGFTVAFGADQPIGETPGFWGDLTQYLGTKNLVNEMAFPPFPETPIPTYVIMAFQMMFAIITVALISGAISDRAKFGGWLLFAFGWFTLAYLPIAHMVWGGGFIGAHIGALDFAGGSAVHINAGAAALALAFVLGRRVGWPKESFKPHNVPFVALGAGLLWFGWFGFNAGSELTADAHHRRRVPQHAGRDRGRPDRLDHRRVAQGWEADAGRGVIRCRGAVSSPSPRRAPTSRRSRRCCSAWSRASCAPWPSA